MGAGNSKPDGTAQHVFNPEAPVRFSSELIDSLQNSPQSDTTRAKALELQVQTRVERELSQLRAKEEQRLRELQDAIASAADASPDAASHEPSLAEKLADSLSSADAVAERQRRRDISRTAVEREIEALRKKLDERKRLEQPDKGVEDAKLKVVECLRVNDRRPLDCWREVEAFKKEVGRLEKEFVERTVR
ncbi:hypothetical protein BFW01_g11383 [Lasiodiplodia theobromae]|uniref:MICOS complex subunit mic19 n=1 Tax=Lasiodiplodia theobromae TaxID=45133 RepID=A0A5N5CX53_9PEZI|nr:uncharacterized protein LTHEOB_1645 [Lasiodiplodia theobromae]KAB2569886.1 MICOS complex subunit mic19 [Lasiodiplodia theobromae]KAF4537454.1 hypothetical protein LTHEOB_1645 [Lasiodiplodia theobromae]KAF9639577.1 hypothetical protein BFW01_g11383 [Lasiodiplodia theobromae]